MTSQIDSDVRRWPWRDTGALIFIVICVLSVAWHWAGFSHSRAGAPLLYMGDAQQYSYIIEESGRTGGLSEISNAGAPFGTQHQDFPNGDWGNLAMARMVAPEGEFGDRFNRYYLLTFLLTSLSGFAAARYIGVGRCWASAVAIAFTLLPFHFARLGHLFYTNYSAAAIAVIIAIALTRPWPTSRRSRYARLVILIAGCLWCGITGVYYALFSCAVIAAVGVAEVVRRREWRIALQYTAAIAFVAMAVGVQLLPSFSLHQKAGPNQEVATRSFNESEIYGLKIAQMIIPSNYNQFKSLRKIREEYDAAAPLVNENGTASLGLLGSLGLLFSFVLLVAIGVAERLPWAVRLTAMLVVTLTVVASVGGFSSIFALEVTPLIRAWNRISPFIGLYSLIVVAGTVQHLVPGRRLAPALGLLAVLLVIVEQRPLRLPGISKDFSATVTRFKSDREFGRALVSKLPANAMVLQVPYIAYPEAGSPFGDYAEFRDNLNAPELWWTHGAMKGRAEGNWLASLGNLPPVSLIGAIRRVGFQAVVVDRTTLAVAPIAAIDNLLKSMPGVMAIQSTDGVQVAYLFPHSEVRSSARAVAAHGGWWPIPAGDAAWWASATGQRAQIKLQKASSGAACRLSATFESAVRRKVVLRGEDGTSLHEFMLFPSTQQNIDVDVPASTNYISVETDVPATKSPGNDRKVSFRMALGSGASCSYASSAIARGTTSLPQQ